MLFRSKNMKVEQIMDLKSVLTIASFLFFAQVISQTGVLNLIATYIKISATATTTAINAEFNKSFP